MYVQTYLYFRLRFAVRFIFRRSSHLPISIQKNPVSVAERISTQLISALTPAVTVGFQDLGNLMSDLEVVQVLEQPVDIPSFRIR